MRGIETLQDNKSRGIVQGSTRFRSLIKEVHRATVAKKSNTINFPSFRARLFEELAFALIANTTQFDSEIWSPSRTLQFFEELYPDTQPIRHNLQSTLLGQYVPDGLRVQVDRDGTENVAEVIEYTTRVKPYQLLETFELKSQLFQQEQRKRPGIFEKSKLHIIVPADADLSIVENFEFLDEIRISKAPFTARDITAFTFFTARKHIHLPFSKKPTNLS